MNKEHREVKPVVHFEMFGSFRWYNDELRTAILYGVVDHPRLGRERVVYTSQVLSVDNEEAPALIETRNTIYKKREQQ